MSRPKVSVIVPCFNASQTIIATLESLRKQTIDDLEIIVINDGSSDQSGELIQEYQSAHPECNIKLFTTSNQGIAATRNYGLEKVTGEYFGFLDSDDTCEPTMFETMYHYAKENHVQLVVSNFYWVNSSGKKLQVEGPYAPGKDMMVHLFAVLWNKLYLTDWVKKTNIHFPNGNRYEDAYFLYCLASQVDSIGFIDQAFVNYVQHPTSITHTNNHQVKNMITVFELIVDFYKQNGLFEAYKESLEYIHIKFFLGNNFLRSIRIQNKIDRKNSILLGWNLLNQQFPKWYQNSYLKREKGLKNTYFRIVRRWNLMFFALIFRCFLKDNL